MVYVCTSVRTSTVPWFVTNKQLHHFVTIVRKDIHGAVVHPGRLVLVV